MGNKLVVVVVVNTKSSIVFSQSQRPNRNEERVYAGDIPALPPFRRLAVERGKSVSSWNIESENSYVLISLPWYVKNRVKWELFWFPWYVEVHARDFVRVVELRINLLDLALLMLFKISRFLVVWLINRHPHDTPWFDPQMLHHILPTFFALSPIRRSIVHSQRLVRRLHYPCWIAWRSQNAARRTKIASMIASRNKTRTRACRMSAKPSAMPIIYVSILS